MTPNSVLPEQLERARKSLWLSREQVAELLGWGSELVRALELNEREPTEDELWDLSELYGRPVSYFFVPSGDAPTKQDFRSDFPLSLGEDAAFRRAVVAEFEQLCRGQIQLERTLGESEDLKRFDEVRSRIEPDTGADSVAEQTRAILGIGDEPVHAPDDLMEALGIRVFVIPVETNGFSGTSWVHPEFGPAMLANRNDPRVRRSFTVAHELAHLLRDGNQTICGFLEGNYSEERWANAFAAAFLLPQSSTLRFVREMVENEEIGGFGTSDRALDRVARHFGVSREAASWRLEELAVLPSGFTAVRRTLWSTQKQFRRGGRGKRWQRRLNDLSRKHLDVTKRAYASGHISLSAAAEFLRLDTEQADEWLQLAAHMP